MTTIQFVLILALCTYLSRVAGLFMMTKVKMNPTLRTYLDLMPLGIIGALIVKQSVIFNQGRPEIPLPYLLGGLLTGVMIKKTNHFLISLVAGVVLGLILRYIQNSILLMD